jgi:predicted dinucleotide-binding enzyme
MEITIIGTGNMARGIATRLLAGGHAVTLVGTSSEKARALAGELSDDVRAAEIGDHLQGDVVVLAIPYTAVDDVLGAYAGQLDGRWSSTSRTRWTSSAFTLLHPGAGSAAQEIAGKAPGARVVKAFNTTFAGTLLEGRVADQPVDMLIASDDEDAKETVSTLVDDGGLRAIDAGPLTRAAELESLGYLHMALQDPLDTGFASAVKFIG